GGLYPAWLAARAGVRAAVLNDAGIGRHSAGIAGVAWLAGYGIAACAVEHRSARIGDSADMLASGIVSTVNDVAARHGCLPGHTCRQAVECLLEHAEETECDVPEFGETRSRVPNSAHRAVWAIDSASLLRAEDARAIVVTGSHGGLLGGKPDHVLDVD